MYKPLPDDVQAQRYYSLIESSLCLNKRISPNTSSILYELDKFVWGVLQDQIQPYYFESMIKPVEKVRLAVADSHLWYWQIAFENINSFITVKQLLEGKVELSSYAEHFFKVLRDLKINDQLHTFPIVDVDGHVIWPPKNTTRELVGWEQFNLILEALRERFDQNSIKRDRERRRRVESIVCRVEDYLNICCQVSEQLYVYEINLTISKSSSHNYSSDVLQLEKLWSEFLKELKNERTLSQVVGYLAKIVYSTVEGYAIQLSLILDYAVERPVDGEIFGGCIYCWHSVIQACGLESRLFHHSPKPPKFLSGDLKLRSDLVDIYAGTLIYVTTKKGSIDPPYQGPTPKKRFYPDAIKILKNSTSDKEERARFDEIERMWGEIDYLKFKSLFFNNTWWRRDLIYIEIIIHALSLHGRGPFELGTKDIARLDVVENPLGLFLRQWFYKEWFEPSFVVLVKLRQRILQSETDLHIQFGQSIRVFCDAVSMFTQRVFSPPSNSYHALDKRTSEILHGWNEFAKILRAELKSKEHDLRKSINDVHVMHNGYGDYLDSLFESHSYLYIVAINLYLGKTTPSEEDSKNLEIKKSSGVTPFIQKCKRLFQIKGFCYKWEYSNSADEPYLRCLLLSSEDITMESGLLFQEKLSKLWSEFFKLGRIELACLANKDPFTFTAPYQIRRSDKQLRKIIKEHSLAYLTKSDLYVNDDRITAKNKCNRGEISSKTSLKNSNK